MKIMAATKLQAHIVFGRSCIGLEAQAIVEFQLNSQEIPSWDSPLTVLNVIQSEAVPPQARGEVKRLGN